MTDTNRLSLHIDIHQHTAENIPEEADITEIVPHVVNDPPKPSSPEREHNMRDSESEEDVTEENVHATLEQLDNTASEDTFTNGTVNQEEHVHPTTINTRGRSVSNVHPGTQHTGILPRSQRVWEMDRQAPECRRCHRRFNFLVRRHHCRRCGQIVCDKCSSNRLRLPVEELVEDPMIPPSQYPHLASQTQRVCDTCFREPIRRSSESYRRRSSRAAYGSNMRRTDSAQSLMIDCPVCGQTFLGMQKGEQEAHLQRCLNVGSPPVQSPRYIVYELSAESTQIGDECPICFDEFEQGKERQQRHLYLIMLY
ncbi:FYVE zinc finger-domain-containing protein [Gilbertella persicaria]|uniref:FYVE zinc finger-domain-containing protein n=1 Tax=Gilbertella persicaria TaxID=101096 RepID=UPI00221EB458|nr:FYVE zinc finger-domain-containing protein [Gilbertella persicaria]KAI8092314.1 FYVE zinc finger-domain-containing protein [Gilbertella persicaria]